MNFTCNDLLFWKSIILTEVSSMMRTWTNTEWNESLISFVTVSLQIHRLNLNFEIYVDCTSLNNECIYCVRQNTYYLRCFNFHGFYDVQWVLIVDARSFQALAVILRCHATLAPLGDAPNGCEGDWCQASWISCVIVDFKSTRFRPCL